MSHNDLKEKWLEHYKTAPAQLEKMGDVKGLISAFNANVDAVIKVSGKLIEEIIEKNNLDLAKIVGEGKNCIQTSEDSIRGFLQCFHSSP